MGAQLALRLLALADVAHRGGVEVALAVLQRADRDLDRELDAVLPLAGQLTPAVEMLARRVGQHRQRDRTQTAAVAAAEQRAGGLADELGLRDAEHRLE